MADYLAGSVVKALDFPPSQYDLEDTLQSNINVSGYTAPTNACSVTFTAPTSGRVKLVVGAGARDDTNNIQVFVTAEIRETNVSGSIVLGASAYRNGYISEPEASDYLYHSRITLVEGLTPGQVYFARIMISDDSASNTADLRLKNLAVIPVP